MCKVQNFKEYRKQIGFLNQDKLKSFLSAKDIKSEIDFSYIDNLNNRLCEIIKILNSIVHKQIRLDDVDDFCKENIFNTYNILKDNKILPKLNNQGRRPEQVYFSWMRGFLISKFFTKALSQIFEINQNDIKIIGDDRLDDIENFKRQPTADLEIKTNGKTVNIEMQSGYKGINDIKKHKVIEGIRQFSDNGIYSLVIHVDFFNGQVAFVNIGNIADNEIIWISRKEMEGQEVFEISQDDFIWSLTETPPALKDLKQIIFNE